MRAYRRFNVHPVLPDPLQPLGRLAGNLRWFWHTPSQDLFRAVDPELWERTGRDPLRLLASVDPGRLEVLAEDRRFVRQLAQCEADLRDYLGADLWFQQYAAEHPEAPRAIGYFSAEFGVSEVLPQYSGGLGILAGDHLKAASDLGVPIIGVGLLYRHGYFRQSLNAEGWQQEWYPLLDPSAMPLTALTEDGAAVTVQVPLHGRTLTAQVWVAQVGRIPLLMLDSDLEVNSEYDRSVTDRLYGGGADHRLAQEVLLGIGGVRALREYCRITGHPEPEVYHANEGHAGFLGLERIREYMDGGADFDTAVELTRAGNVFTTHTPVPAGIDRFDAAMVHHQFSDFAPLPVERVLALGAEDYEGGDPSRFNMAVMGFRLGQRANGVSLLHGEVSREMFNGLWPGFDTTEVPIGSVTNGVHHPTWVHPAWLQLLGSPPGQEEDLDGCDWEGLEQVDDDRIWSIKRRMRADLVTMARERLRRSHADRGLGGGTEWIDDVLDPKVLTLGFARRGASYKRLTLMLRDPERLIRLLNHPTTPIQIVVAGKAHPADDVGKSLIQEMVRFADREDVRHRLVFLPDYDIAMARTLYPGCDVWMNNPLRPFEACGTSGMKAALNGAANLSIRDGWWDEWSDPRCGWDIPSAESISDPEQRDAVESQTLYSIIEHQIVPRFYETDVHQVPTAWVRLIRDTISILGPKVLASRMVREYVTELYAPAAVSARAGEPATATEVAAWKRRVREEWPTVKVLHVESLSGESVQVGGTMDVVAHVQLGGLGPDDVEVQMVLGDLNGDDQLSDVESEAFTGRTGSGDGVWRYTLRREARRTGSRGFTVRVVPKHAALAHPAEMGLAALPVE
ncbi:alpha-glucan family phosphorylase [Desertihabitans brevis]|uniref:glycogen phosphorylase n=1 Tax=Desertihabitans brevis TaxID=2268447 RepID=A0A367YYT0_9ACTN|nr:alpha-glucan family phosphorylase [Desertihabitans brevis]RCK71073.1 alpha-glucan family phosphorylase [Desertihabitans brevis]